jgi:MYXO-CTERM domain-containing protein
MWDPAHHTITVYTPPLPVATRVTIGPPSETPPPPDAGPDAATRPSGHAGGDDSGCGCEVGRAPRSGAGGWALPIVLLLLIVVRRRRTTSS